MVDQYQENGIGQFYTGLKGNCVELYRFVLRDNAFHPLGELNTGWREEE